MKFLRPVHSDFPLTRHFGESGSYYTHHIHETTGLWVRGRVCFACKELEPCKCLNPDPRGHHSGTDFACPEGTPVLAAADGMVVKVGLDEPDSGQNGMRLVQILYELSYDSWWIRYRHLRTVHESPGNKVKAGDRIGFSGRNGESFLCIELLDRNLQFHPMEFTDE